MAARFWRASRARPSLFRSHCPANRRACASWKRSAATRPQRSKRLSIAAPERVAPACRHFGACGGCSYQHTDYATQLAFKQAILRETLERGGVHVPDEIAVLAAEPWGYRNRIRLAFDAAGKSRLSRAPFPCGGSDQRVPHRRAVADRGRAVLSRKWPRNLAPALRPTEISLFCDADETALLASVFIARSRKDSLRRVCQRAR